MIINPRRIPPDVVELGDRMCALLEELQFDSIPDGRAPTEREIKLAENVRECVTAWKKRSGIE